MDTQSIIMTVAGAVYTALMGIVGYLIHGRVSSIDDTTKAIGVELRTLDRKVVDIGTEVVEIKTTQKHHGEQLDEFCERIERVETHVANTERLTVLENTMHTAAEEIKELRAWRHSSNDKQHEQLVRVEASIAALSDRIIAVEKALHKAI